jgi:hypothetical protein
MKNLPLWPFLAFRTIVESVSSEESTSDWGANPPPATMNVGCCGLDADQVVGSVHHRPAAFWGRRTRSCSEKR